MTDKDILKTIKQEGIGKYLGKFDTNLGKIDEYFSYVRLSLTSKNQYYVDLFLNPFYKKYSEKCLYEGNNKHEAEKIFHKVIEKDREKKENWMHKKYGKKIVYN
ncbi:MAG: hypothetical protein AABY06_02750 [Nanoarchaeota archaeon]